MKEIIKALNSPIIKMTLIIGTLAIIIILLLDWKFYPDFLDVLVEAHGLIFDVIFFGIILGVYDVIVRKREEELRFESHKKEQISRYKEEIDDFRYWDEKEAKFRIHGNIKRLNKLGETEIDLTDCYLEQSTFEKNIFIKSSFKRADLKKSIFIDSTFKECNFIAAKMIKTAFSTEDKEKEGYLGSSFENCNFQAASLYEIFAINASFKDCKFRGSKFEEGIFIFSNFSNADFRTEYDDFVTTFNGTILSSCNLTNSDFRGAKLINVDIQGANIEGIKLQGAIIENLQIDEEQIPFLIKGGVSEENIVIKKKTVPNNV